MTTALLSSAIVEVTATFVMTGRELAVAGPPNRGAVSNLSLRISCSGLVLYMLPWFKKLNFSITGNPINSRGIKALQHSSLNCRMHSSTGHFLDPSPRARIPPVLQLIRTKHASWDMKSLSHLPGSDYEIKEVLYRQARSKPPFNGSQSLQLDDRSNTASPSQVGGC